MPIKSNTEVLADDVMWTLISEINCGQADRFKKGKMQFNAMAGIIQKKFPEANFRLIVEGVELVRDPGSEKWRSQSTNNANL